MRSRVNLKHLSRIIAVVGLGLTFASMATVSRAQLSPTPTPTPELVHYGDLIDLDVEGDRAVVSIATPQDIERILVEALLARRVAPA